MGVFCGWFAAAFYTLIAGAGITLRTLFMPQTVGAYALLTGQHVSPFKFTGCPGSCIAAGPLGRDEPGVLAVLCGGGALVVGCLVRARDHR